MTIGFDLGHDLDLEFSRSNQKGCKLVIHDHDRDILVTKVRSKDLPDSDWGDFRCRHAVDSSSYFMYWTPCMSVYLKSNDVWYFVFMFGMFSFQMCCYFIPQLVCQSSRQTVDGHQGNYIRPGQVVNRLLYMDNHLYGGHFNTTSHLDKIAAISQMTCSNAFAWIKIFEFLIKLHWNMFLRN